MKIKLISHDRRQDWNALIAKEPSFALFQSWEWGEFKEKLGWKAYRIGVLEDEKIVAGAQMLIKFLPAGLPSFAYIPRGPIGSWMLNEIMSTLLLELQRIALLNRAVFLRIEPPIINDLNLNRKLRQHRYRVNARNNQPRATIIINLIPDEDPLNILPRKTRYSIRYAHKKGVTVRCGNKADLPAFYRLMKATAKRGKFIPRTYDYYKNEWDVFSKEKRVTLLFADYQDQLLAARMVFCFGKHAADIHAASSEKYRKLRPNHLLVAAGMRWARSQGCKTYDLWGVPDEVGKAKYEEGIILEPDRSDGLWGVYRFKRSFSKNIIFYTGAHDFVFSSVLYTVIASKLLSGASLDRFSSWLDRFR